MTYPFYFISNKSQTVSTFEECINKKILPKSKYNKKEMNSVDAFIKTGGFALFKKMEEEYGCTSICKSPLFYLTLDVSKGKPK